MPLEIQKKNNFRNFLQSENMLVWKTCITDFSRENVYTEKTTDPFVWYLIVKTNFLKFLTTANCG